jgi:peroxiredoxin
MITHYMTSRVASLAVVALLSTSSVQAAEPPAVLELLKALNLSGYRKPLEPPRFSGIAADEKKVSLSGMSGRVVLLNFWATWCLECRTEMPDFERLHRAFSAKGLAVAGVNAREAKLTIQAYAKELDLTFPLVQDPRGKINSEYGVIGLPTTFVIARNGRAVALAIGPREWDGKNGRALIQKLLAEP